MKVLFKMSVSLGLALLLLAYSGCLDDCEEAELLGNLSLSQNSIEFMPYRGGQVLVYEDSLGREVNLSSSDGLRVFENQLFFDASCTRPTFYQAEVRNIQFANNDSTVTFDVSLEFGTFSKDFDNTDSIFLYQILHVDQSSLGNLNIVTDAESDFPLMELERLEERTILLDSVTLFDKTFLNVYIDTFQDPPTLYYNKEFGIVAFKDSQQVTYVLKEIRG